MHNQRKSDNPINKLKYLPKVLTALSFLILLVIVMILFLGRKMAFFKMESILNVVPDFYLHISNFSISYLLFAIIGYFWLMVGVKFKYITALGISILISNLIYELFIPVLNTPDIVDAYFGFAGTILAFIFLGITKKFGLKLNPFRAEKDSKIDLS